MHFLKASIKNGFDLKYNCKWGYPGYIGSHNLKLSKKENHKHVMKNVFIVFKRCQIQKW